MKKLFISCPMRGRSEENIKKSMEKMHKLMEVILGEELEPIQTYKDYEVPEGANHSVYCLGKSISLMAEADYFVGFGFYLNILKKYVGCEVETSIANGYDIPCYLIDNEDMAKEILSDLKEI